MDESAIQNTLISQDKEFFKRIVDNLKDIILVIDSNGKILTANRAIERYGWKRKNIVNKKIHDLINKRRAGEIIEKIKGREIISGKIEMETPEGRITFQYFATPLKINESVVGSQVTFKEISTLPTEDFQILDGLTKKILRILDRDTLYKTTYKELKNLIDFDYYLVGIYDRNKNTIKTEIGISEDKILAQRVFKVHPKKPLLGWIVHNKKSLLIKDMLNERLPAEPIHAGEICRSWLGVPLLIDDLVLGVINIQSFEPNTFGEREKRILETVASHFAIGLLNITLYEELKRSKEELNNKVSKMNLLLKNIQTGIIIVKDKKILYANRAFKAMLGYEKMDVTGASILKFIHPDVQSEAVYYYQNIISKPDFQEVDDIMKFVKSDGTELYGHVIIKPLLWDGEKVYLVTIEDITPLKQMEETILSLTDSFRKIKIAGSEDEIYDIAIHSLKNVLNFNNAAIFKLEEDELVLVRTIGYRISHFKMELNGRRGIVAWVARNKRPIYVPDVSKEPLYIDTGAGSKCEYATPIIVDGEVYGVLDVEGKKVDGISEESRNLIDMLAEHMSVALMSLKKQKALEKAKNYQELMLRIVSHDLKNPLAVISGYTELIREEFREEYIDVIEEAVDRAVEIIEKARLFSKLGTRGVEEEKVEINLKNEIEEIASIIMHKYPEGEINIDLPEISIMGHTLLREVFLNILDNAFKYGAKKVSINAEMDDENVKIRISDDGPGIPEDKKEIIFDAFETLEQGGSGLGLNIAKMIVEMHNGRVWVEDNKPRGSVFIIQLPMNQA